MKQRSNARRWRSLLIGLVALLAAYLLLILAVVSFTWVTRKRAEECLRSVRGMEIGRATFQDVLRLKSKFRYFDITLEKRSCNSESCALLFPFDNRWLHRLGLAPLTEFGVGVGVEEGRVVGRGIGYASYGGSSAGRYGMGETPPHPGKKDVNVHVFWDSERLPIDVQVRLTTAAPAALRERAYSFDLSCLSKLGGCKDRRSIIPRGMETPE